MWEGSIGHKAIEDSARLSIQPACSCFAGRVEPNVDGDGGGKDKAYRYYQPVREAIVRYCILRGSVAIK